MIPPNDPGMQLLSGAIALVLPLATMFAWLLSLGLLRLYRRAVLRSMDAATDSATTEPASTESAAHLRTGETEADHLVLDSDPATTSGEPAETLYSESLGAPWRTAAISPASASGVG